MTKWGRGLKVGTLCPEKADHMSKSEGEKVTVNLKVKHLQARIKTSDLRRNTMGSYAE